MANIKNKGFVSVPVAVLGALILVGLGTGLLKSKDSYLTLNKNDYLADINSVINQQITSINQDTDAKVKAAEQEINKAVTNIQNQINKVKKPVQKKALQGVLANIRSQGAARINAIRAEGNKKVQDLKACLSVPSSVTADSLNQQIATINQDTDAKVKAAEQAMNNAVTNIQKQINKVKKPVQKKALQKVLANIRSQGAATINAIRAEGNKQLEDIKKMTVCFSLINLEQPTATTTPPTATTTPPTATTTPPTATTTPPTVITTPPTATTTPPTATTTSIGTAEFVYIALTSSEKALIAKDGQLMYKFKVIARQGDVSLTKFSFSVSSSTAAGSNATTTKFSLYVFTDSSYSSPDGNFSSGVNAGGLVNAGNCFKAGPGNLGAGSVLVEIYPNKTGCNQGATALKIPSGESRWFKLQASVGTLSPSGTAETISVQLEGDAAFPTETLSK